MVQEAPSSVDIETGRVVDENVYTFEVSNDGSIASTIEVTDYELIAGEDNSLRAVFTISGAVDGIATQPNSSVYLSRLTPSFSDQYGDGSFIAYNTLGSNNGDSVEVLEDAR